ncbi:MAG: hypothetical protein E6J92_08750 [Methanobacteriota archaeon]|nr:MAG: hypothetical protein E6K00_04350 [Euryarchaeota archaeon]TLZ99463.1 MAG: hypothetical protein E6J96_00625 [Euryarchaeota archaeon]TMA00792.1 MAG: hypothetical protein E6J92_08750 [Euryarchaeota archaeon]
MAPRWWRRSKPVGGSGNSWSRSSKATRPPAGSSICGNPRMSSRWRSRSIASRTTKSWSGTPRCTVAVPGTSDSPKVAGKFIARDSVAPLGENMGVLGIDTIAIVVSDRHKAIRWYRDVLGLDVAYIGPRISNADPSVQGTPDDAGHWIEMGPLRPRARVHVCQMDETEPGPTGITFLTDNILADYERMQEMGVEFPVPPEKMEWGEWLGQFADPDGNVFDLKQPISTRDWKGQPPADEPPTRPRVKRARRARASPAGGRGRRTRRPHRTAPAW